jgi:crotonobetainyl-CoA:carnitine CoA-transferase CaiB-like acyl-CoA transferase
MADWMNVPYMQTRYGGKPPARVGLKHPTIAPYGAYECSDGKAVLIAIQNEREWVRLCTDVLRDETIATDPRFVSNTRRVENRPTLEEVVAGVFARDTREQMIERLQQARIAFGRLSDLQGLLDHPQNRLISVTTSAGDIEMLAPGAVIRGQTPQYRPVPDLGEQGDGLRREFGILARGLHVDS